jgi:2-oxo-4-hydroxy-4-carboxy-5-ureidoimidazoline decarboxylase
LVLLSVRGERRLPYAGFHTGYKTTLLKNDELIHSVCLPRRFSQHLNYARKVGARDAQAISKICIAALGRAAEGVVMDVRIAMGSVAPIPLRLTETESIVKGKTIDDGLLLSARKAAADEIKPIDDIRSTARYRAAVAGNLVAEFLSRLRDYSTGGERQREHTVLAEWNQLPNDGAAQAILACCGSDAWAHGMAAQRPLAGEAALLAAADATWRALAPADWMEAFRSHPRIGESRSSHSAAPRAVQWSAQEQRNVGYSDADVKIALSEANREYERRFGRIFIVCATGKSAAEILAILRRRLENDPRTELHEATEQQRQIMQQRLKKWLEG